MECLIFLLKYSFDITGSPQLMILIGTGNSVPKDLVLKEDVIRPH